MSIQISFVNSNRMRRVHFPDGDSVEVASTVRVVVPFDLSNVNAVFLLSALGFDTDLSFIPEIPVKEFSEALTLYLTSDLGALIDQEGRPTHKEGNVVEVGRSPGYLRSRVSTLIPIVEKAMGRGATHVCLG